jgi:2-phosphosulfolactate phosphatase
MNYFNQDEFNIRCEWGENGVKLLAPTSDAVIIVDVLSFSTCVDIATANGALVFPCALRGDPAKAFADQHQAILAGDGGSPYKLSPSSLANIPSDARLVLPSPNGSTLSLLSGSTPTFAGCLRNARAVALSASERGAVVSVIPAGERWRTDGALRPALEDFIGTGAIIHHLKGEKSPEAIAAEQIFLHYQDDLLACLLKIGSGKELVDRGRAQDVELSAMLNISDSAPQLIGDAYQNKKRLSQ